ncbi:hypothetical protein LQ938_06515 [Microbacterium sp. cx-55]|uniref:hypothetical protein n=1 Tax=Microbacterium sp. cx-55 TaxID=2875948 RepID=UPI001CBDEBF0|nr:hypothetical protein [Microbacterium sp. cx-55]MBZ4486603.1 hypothetical protein [Microbacterium sp. cx-55]UGB36430.1 hypothetical protein LQ938_06515 [Microbacterium sp. cx-55]
MGACSVENSGSQIDIGAQTGGGPGRGNTGPGANNGGNSNGGNSGAPVDPDAPRYDENGNLLRPGCETVLCRGNYTAVGLPDVTLADIASFRPAAPSLASEPAGIGIVGMPTNLVSAASAQSIPGTLFGYDVVVRFTPIGYRFAYGDGATRTAASGGASWTALGQAQFTPTGTSHAYPARGDYIAAVTVQYAPEVSFDGGGWREIDGIVEATTGGHPVQIVEARTALVDRTCVENPTGPGC